jgi:hypothetical protein
VHILEKNYKIARTTKENIVTYMLELPIIETLFAILKSLGS